MNKLKAQQQTDVLATKIAAAILLQNKELTVSQIRALPFVESDQEAMTIAKQLGLMFEVEVEQVRLPRSGSPITQWTDLLKLKKAAHTHA